MPSRSAFVYYTYDHDGDLLYIGVTDDLAQRLENHRWKKSPWIREATRVRWEQYASREQAELVEERQIRAVMPKYNRAHNWRREEAAEMGFRFLPDERACRRLAAVLRRERTGRRMSQRVVAQRARVEVEDVRALERAERDRYAVLVLEGVEAALDWRPGAIEAVLFGGEPLRFTAEELEERAFAEARRMAMGDRL